MAGGSYATGSDVPVGRSRDEIERTLARYGASEFAYGQRAGQAVVGFAIGNRQVRFSIALPVVDDVARTPGGKLRSNNQIGVELDKATRQRWRALLLVVKAKLESVQAGIETFEE